jgi:hypothetical protein
MGTTFPLLGATYFKPKMLIISCNMDPPPPLPLRQVCKKSNCLLGGRLTLRGRPTYELMIRGEGLQSTPNSYYIILEQLLR